MDLAALAALRQPVDLLIGGLLYEVRPRPVIDWIRSLTESSPFLELLPYDVAVRLSERLHDPYDTDVDHEVLEDAWREALESHSGWRWWEAIRLLAQLVHEWHTVSGELALRGVDLRDSPLDLALDAVYRLVFRNLDEKQTREREEWLHKVPPELEGTDEAPERHGFTPEEQAAAFFTAARSSGAARPSAGAPARLGST